MRSVAGSSRQANPAGSTTAGVLGFQNRKWLSGSNWLDAISRSMPGKPGPGVAASRARPSPLRSSSTIGVVHDPLVAGQDLHRPHVARARDGSREHQVPEHVAAFRGQHVRFGRCDHEVGRSQLPARGECGRTRQEFADRLQRRPIAPTRRASRSARRSVDSRRGSGRARARAAREACSGARSPWRSGARASSPRCKRAAKKDRHRPDGGKARSVRKGSARRHAQTWACAPPRRNRTSRARTPSRSGRRQPRPAPRRRAGSSEGLQSRTRPPPYCGIGPARRRRSRRAHRRGPARWAPAAPGRDPRTGHRCVRGTRASARPRRARRPRLLA